MTSLVTRFLDSTTLSELPANVVLPPTMGNYTAVGHGCTLQPMLHHMRYWILCLMIRSMMLHGLLAVAKFFQFLLVTRVTT